MTTPRETNGGASAPPPVLPFPQTKKALRVRRMGMGGAGLLMLQIMEREGEPVPANVERFDQPGGAVLPDKTPELLLALLLWSALSAKKQESIKATLRCLAYGKPADPCAVRLNNLLRGRS